MAKAKRHDCLQEMTEFSRVWKEYVVLYDKDAWNKLFSQDFAAGLVHLNKCYMDMSHALNLTVPEVKAHRVKYRDAVTKAVKQYSNDLRNNTTSLPTAAATKLSVFNWLLPYSCHYDPTLMDGQNLDQYVECILRGHANHLDHNKVDSTEVQSVLASVSTYLRDAGKPWHLIISSKKLQWNMLPSIAMQNRVCFLHDYMPMTVFEDESASCEFIDSFCIAELPCSVSDWLLRNIDPMFDWVKAGMYHFSHHVTQCLPPCDGKLAIVKHADAMALALNRAAAASREACLAVDKARNSKTLCVKSFCYSYTLAGCGTSVVKSDTAQAAQGETVRLRLLMDDIFVVIQKVLNLEAARDTVCVAPVRIVMYKPSLLRLLEAVREKSKLYSSQFWNLPKRHWVVCMSHLLQERRGGCGVDNMMPWFFCLRSQTCFIDITRQLAWHFLCATFLLCQVSMTGLVCVLMTDFRTSDISFVSSFKDRTCVCTHDKQTFEQVKRTSEQIQ